MEMEKRGFLSRVKLRNTVTFQASEEPGSHLQGKVSVLLFLAYLQAGEMWILELQIVLLLKILSYCTLHGLAVLEL